MGFNCLKAREPLQGDGLLFTIQFPGVPDTQLIDPGRMKGWVDLRATLPLNIFRGVEIEH